MSHAQASGSGGTAGGLALGLHLSKADVSVHAYGVCDDPAYFYDYIDGLFRGLGATPDVVGEVHITAPNSGYEMQILIRS